MIMGIKLFTDMKFVNITTAINRRNDLERLFKRQHSALYYGGIRFESGPKLLSK